MLATGNIARGGSCYVDPTDGSPPSGGGGMGVDAFLEGGASLFDANGQGTSMGGPGSNDRLADGGTAGYSGRGRTSAFGAWGADAAPASAGQSGAVGGMGGMGGMGGAVTATTRVGRPGQERQPTAARDMAIGAAALVADRSAALAHSRMPTPCRSRR